MIISPDVKAVCIRLAPSLVFALCVFELLRRWLRRAWINLPLFDSLFEDVPWNFGERVIRGLCSGCVILLFIELFGFLNVGILANHLFGLHWIFSAIIWEATGHALGYVGMILLVASGVMYFFVTSKIAHWGFGMAALAFLGVLCTPAFVRL